MGTAVAITVTEFVNTNKNFSRKLRMCAIRRDFKFSNFVVSSIFPFHTVFGFSRAAHKHYRYQRDINNWWTNGSRWICGGRPRRISNNFRSGVPLYSPKKLILSEKTAFPAGPEDVTAEFFSEAFRSSGVLRSKEHVRETFRCESVGGLGGFVGDKAFYENIEYSSKTELDLLSLNLRCARPSACMGKFIPVFIITPIIYTCQVLLQGHYIVQLKLHLKNIKLNVKSEIRERLNPHSRTIKKDLWLPPQKILHFRGDIIH